MNTFYAILIAVLAVAVAVTIVVLLSYFVNKKRGIVDSKVSYIHNLLPGIDCRACGCASCEEFACKVAAYERDSSECRVNTFRNKQKLRRHFERPLDSNIKRVAFVKCKGGDKCKDKYIYVGETSCSACEKLHSGVKACKAACLGCGDCVNVCPYGAIEVNDRHVAVVNSIKCTGCGKCLQSCPNNLIEMIPSTQRVGVVCNNTFDDAGIVKICEVGCVRCGSCEKVCPTGAITMKNGLPVVDASKCTNCGKCVSSCPSKVIARI